MSLKVKITSLAGIERLVDVENSRLIRVSPGDKVEILGDDAKGLSLTIAGNDVAVHLASGKELLLSGYVGAQQADQHTQLIYGEVTNGQPPTVVGTIEQLLTAVSPAAGQVGSEQSGQRNDDGSSFRPTSDDNNAARHDGPNVSSGAGNVGGDDGLIVSNGSGGAGESFLKTDGSGDSRITDIPPPAQIPGSGASGFRIIGLGTDTGRSDSDGITNQAENSLRGSGGTPGATVEVLINFENRTYTLGTAIVGADGTWEADIGDFEEEDGTYSLTAVEHAASDGVTLATAQFTATLDTEAPELSIDRLDDNVGSVTGAVNYNYVTDDGTPTVEGFAEPGTTIVFSILDAANHVVESRTFTAVGTGEWTFTPQTALTDGLYRFQATAVDLAGNESLEVFPVYIDRTPPAVRDGARHEIVLSDFSITPGAGVVRFDQLGAGSTLFDAGTDARGSGNYNNFRIDIATTDTGGGNSSSQVFGIDVTGASFTRSGNGLYVGLQRIATVTAGDGGDLHIAFVDTGVALPRSLVNEVFDRVTYRNNDANLAHDPTFSVRLTDVAGNTSVQTVHVDVRANTAPALADGTTMTPALYTLGNAPVLIDGGADLRVTDPDANGNFTATINGLLASDTLIDHLSIDATLLSATGAVLTANPGTTGYTGSYVISAAAGQELTRAEIESLLRNIRFDSSGNDATTRNLAITVSDGQASSNTLDLHVNFNHAPLIGSGASFSIAENTTAVGQVMASDEDAGTLLSYTLSGTDAALFGIDANGNLSFNAAPDYEGSHGNTYHLTVAVSDGLATRTQDLTVSVTGVNDNAPVIAPGGSYSLPENTTTVGQIQATDADVGDVLSYTLSGTDAGLFNIDANGNLSFITAPDFEGPHGNQYDLRVSVSDGVHTTAQDLAVTVRDVAIENLAPTAGDIAVDVVDGSTVATVNGLSGRIDGRGVSNFFFLDTNGLSGTIQDLNVHVSLNGEDPNSALRIELSYSGANGTHYILANGNGGSRAGGYRDTTFDDEAAAALSQGDATFTGPFRPNDSLSVFDGLNPNGAWALFITSNGTDPYYGPLSSWSLELTLSAPPTVSVNGNALQGSSDPENNPLSVNGIRTGMEAAGGTFTAVGASGDTILVGTYGSLTLRADGTYTYRADYTDADTRALAANESAVENFTYRISDGHGGTDDASLAFTIHGRQDAPLLTDGVNTARVNVVSQEGSAAIDAGGDIRVTGDNGTGYSAAGSIAGYVNGADHLTLGTGAPAGAVLNVASDGSFTITGAGLTAADIQQAIRTLAFGTTDTVSAGETRGVALHVTDGAGVNTSSITLAIDLTASVPPAQTPAPGLSGGLTLLGVERVSTGISVSDAGDVNNDGIDDVIVGSLTGGAYVVFGRTGQAGGTISLGNLNGMNGVHLTGPAADRTGYSVSSAGDINGDGVADLIVGAYRAGPNNSAGSSYVVFGGNGFGAGGSIDLRSLNGVTGFRLDGVNVDQSGRAVSSAGDVNGDGFDDLIIGGPNANNIAGVTYVVFGGANVGASGTINLSTLTNASGFRFTGPGPSNLGLTVSSAGDVNGDGIDDLAVGGQQVNAGDGAGYILFGGSGVAANNGINAATLNGTNGFRLTGSNGEHVGRSIANAGDINGDGFDDLIIGAPFVNVIDGAAYVVFGSAGAGAGGNISLSGLQGSNGFRLQGALGNYAGFSVSSAGDVNGDGFADLIIGAYGANSSSGAAYVVFGGTNVGSGGIIDLSTLSAGTGFRLDGVSPNSLTGHAVSAAGDINGDGFDDLIVGADQTDSGFGAAHIVFGGNFTGAVTRDVTGANHLLTGTTAVDVLNGSADRDTLVGGGGGDVIHAGAGDDVLAISDQTFQHLDGGTGIDTLRLDAGNLDLTHIANNRIQSIERIDLKSDAGSNILTLDVSDLLHLSEGQAVAGTHNSIVVDAGGNDQVHLADLAATPGSWVANGTRAIGSNLYNIVEFHQGDASGAVAATLYVEQGAVVSGPGNSTIASAVAGGSSFITQASFNGLAGSSPTLQAADLFDDHANNIQGLGPVGGHDAAPSSQEAIAIAPAAPALLIEDLNHAHG